MEAFLKLITPLVDARLVLAIVIVVCATWALLGGRLDGTQWAVADQSDLKADYEAAFRSIVGGSSGASQAS